VVLALMLAGARGLAAAGLAVAFTVAAVVAGQLRSDRPLTALLGLSAGAFAAVAYLDIAGGYPGFRAAAALSTVFLAATVAAPRVVLRLARLHGPQLPRTAEDLQVDVEPLDADRVVGRTALADRCLSVLMVATAAVFGMAYPLLLAAPGWAPATFAALVAVAAALRARIHLTVTQRIALSAAAVLGVTLLAHDLATGAGRFWVPALLLAAFAAAIVAALRPPSRRPRPVWAHLANVAETITLVAVVPVLLQVLGVYARVRGLAG
jgi:type VII secretion integral membrane protein EccD